MVTGYIRNPITWNAVKVVQVQSYDLPLECRKGEVGSASVLGTVDKSLNRYALSLEDIDGIWIINGISAVNNGVTSLQVEDGTAIMEEFVTGYTTSTITYPLIFPIGLMPQPHAGATVPYTHAYAESSDGLHPRYRSIHFVEGKDSFEWAYPYYSGGGWSASASNMENAIGDILSNVDYTDAMVDGPDVGSDRIISVREMIRALQMAGIKINFSVVPYIYEEMRFEVLAGDGIEYGGTVYRVVGTNTSGAAYCVEDGTVTVVYRSSTAPTFQSSYYYFNSNKLSIAFKRGVYTEISADKTELQLDISGVVDTSLAEPVYFNDGHSSVISESYDEKDIISHITIFNKNFDQWYDFYLTALGQVTDDKSLQVIGGSNYIVSDLTTVTWANGLPLAQNEFSNNSDTHKIEFYSDKELYMGQPVKLMLDRGILDTVISKVSIVSNDNRRKYQCGDIPASVVDRLQTFRWVYGARMPLSAKKGSLYIEG